MKKESTSIKKTFIRYLLASFGSALVMSIYSIVDAMCVGNYHHEVGTAALAVVMPLWTIIYSSGLLFGIGGSTIMMSLRGKGDTKEGNRFFSASIIGGLSLSILIWLVLIFFQEPLLVAFGAHDEEVLALAMDYTFGMKLALPVFLSTQLLSAFVRSDNDPLLATLGVIIGGVFNVFGDIFFVFDFGLGMGIKGAGLATMGGQFVTVAILCIHFFLKKNTLKFEKPTNPFSKMKKVIVVGLPSFILDVAMGVFTILFNNQIVNYYEDEVETTTLAIYGVACNITALIQSLAYAVGQASQPLISKSFGAGDNKKVKKFLKYGVISCAIITVIMFPILEAFPIQTIKIFMSFKEGSLITSLAPKFLRLYYIAYLFTIINVFFTYYFQSLLKATRAFIISLLRGIVISCALLFIMPLIFGADSIWLSMAITEVIIFIIIMVWIFIDKMKARKNIKSTVVCK